MTEKQIKGRNHQIRLYEYQEKAVKKIAAQRKETLSGVIGYAVNLMIDKFLPEDAKKVKRASKKGQ